MSTYIFWRCMKCDNLLVRPERKGRPTRCYNCRSKETEYGDSELYEQVPIYDIEGGLAR